jgi:hypothetical protein
MRGALVRLAVLGAVLAGCGAPALAPGDGGADAPAVPDAASAEVGGLADLNSLVGTMAFNEPMNDGFDRALVPTGSSPGVFASPDGHITATIATSFVGPLPDADQRREVLFWNVSGQFPFGRDAAQTIAMSATEGVGATSADDRTATFTIEGTFDPGVRSASGAGPFEIDVGLTWVRVVKKSGVLSFQVIPGWRESFSLEHQVSWDGAPHAADGPFGYYAPLTDDTPGLGASFDYPAWIRAHVTW